MVDFDSNDNNTLFLEAWCVDIDRALFPGNFSADTYSTYVNNIPSLAIPDHEADGLPAVNWLINQYEVGNSVTNSSCSNTTITYKEIQYAIWRLVENLEYRGYDAFIDGYNLCVGEHLFIIASQNNDFEPECDDKLAVLLAIDEQDGTYDNQVLVVVIPPQLACVCSSPSSTPSASPSSAPTSLPSRSPSDSPSEGPTASPSEGPTIFSSAQHLCRSLKHEIKNDQICSDNDRFCHAVADLDSNGGESCDDWCGQADLDCVRAWKTTDDTCRRRGKLACDKPVKNAICKCKSRPSPQPSHAPSSIPSSQSSTRPTEIEGWTCRKPENCSGNNCNIVGGCGEGVPAGYYPDLTNCNSYCKCTGTTASSRYETCLSGLVWDSFGQGINKYLESPYGKNGAWGTNGGICQWAGQMSNKGKQRPGNCL